MLFIRLKKFAVGTFLLSSLFGVISFLVLLIYKYSQYCPNKYVLTWDPASRISKSYEMAGYLRDFDILSFFRMILDAPTWPRIRNIFESILLLLGLSPEFTVLFLTVLTLILVLVFVCIFFWRWSHKSLFQTTLLFSVFWILIFQSPMPVLYSFSGMLEIQGSLFFLIAAVGFYFYWKTGRWNLLFFLGAFGLFFTKYPYGLLWIVTISFYYIFYRFLEVAELVQTVMLHLWNRRSEFILLLLSVFLLLPTIVLPVEWLPGKSSGYLKYSSAILFFVFLIRFIIDASRRFGSQNSFLLLIQYQFLPILLWFGLHPDRFQSGLSTIAHSQSGTNLNVSDSFWSLDFWFFYWRELIENLTYSKVTLTSLVALGVISLWRSRYRRHKKSLAVQLFILIVLQIFLLTALTPNHQQRHIYHLFPAIFFLGCLVLLELIQSSGRAMKLSGVIIALGLIQLMLIHPIQLWQKLNVCFGGIEAKPYDFTRNFRKTLQSIVPESDRISFRTYLPEDSVLKPELEWMVSEWAFQNRVELVKREKDAGLNLEVWSECPKEIESQGKIIYQYERKCVIYLLRNG